MLRRSRYVITVPGSHGEYLFVNTFSGAMIAGTEEVLRILNGKAECAEEMLSSLISSGFLTELSPKEETEAAFQKLESIRRIYKEHTLFALILTYACNMRCDYCFQSYVFGRDDAWLQHKMTFEQVDAAFEAMTKLNPELQNPVHLFGGEPLIYKNYELVKYILEKGTSEGKSFLIVTNGLEADRFIPLFQESNIVSLQITVDGIQKVHDRRKKTLDGSGSFQRIVKSIDCLADAGITVYVKAAVDHSTVKMLPAWAVMAVFDRSLDLELDGVFVHDSPLSWAARNNSKPGRSDRECWVLHGSNEWSGSHLEKNEEEVSADLLQAFFEAIGSQLIQPIFAKAHRWRYAQAENPLKVGCLWDAKLRLGACGDWCQMSRIEGAFLGGMAMAGRVLSLPQSEMAPSCK